jgi:ADP-heptose:LPS heptosyltransferase
MSGRPTALVLRALGLGDLLTGIPALRGVRAALPEHRLMLAAPAHWAPLVRLIGCVDEHLPLAGLEAQWPADLTGGVDVAVNLHGSGPQSHRLLLHVAPRELIAFACPPEHPAGPRAPQWPAGEHEVRRWCSLVDAALGQACDPGALRIGRPDVAPVLAQPYAVVHPGAASASRRWPPERFAEVGRWLRAQGLQVLVTAGPGESTLGRQLADAIGGPALIGAGIEQMAAAVADAQLVVCGDTGVAHLASAYARPSVVLFGPVSPALWGPPASGPHTVLWHGDGTGDPHGREVDPALVLVDVTEVIAACQHRLAVAGPYGA